MSPQKNAQLQKRIVNVRSLLKKDAGGRPSAATPAPLATKPIPAKPVLAKPVPAKPAADKASSGKLGAVLSNVALVNAVVTACGGVENARSAAEAVQACGGVGPFIQHLELIAGLRAKGK